MSCEVLRSGLGNEKILDWLGRVLLGNRKQTRAGKNGGVKPSTELNDALEAVKRDSRDVVKRSVGWTLGATYDGYKVGPPTRPLI